MASCFISGLSAFGITFGWLRIAYLWCNDHSCLLNVMFAHGKLCRIKLLPVSLIVARGQEFEAISARMEMLCAEFGTQLMRQDDRLV